MKMSNATAVIGFGTILHHGGFEVIAQAALARRGQAAPTG